MTDTRKKASMSQVLADIKPYITKKFMAAPCIKEQDIQAICQILLPRYKNGSVESYLRQKFVQQVVAQTTHKIVGKRWSDTTGIIYMDTPAVRHRAGIPLA